MNSRIRMIRKTLGLSQAEFGARIGLKQGAVSLLEKGKTNISAKNIVNICATYNVNEDWLRTGEGAMYEEDKRRQKALLAHFSELDLPFQEYLIEEARRLLELQSKLGSPLQGPSL